MPESPRFSIGLIADIQYADREGHGRYDFRAVPKKLSRLIEQFNSRHLDAVIQLGDIVEGSNENTRSEFEMIFSVLQTSRYPLKHVIGNHCLFAGLDYLLRAYQLPSPYYEFHLGNWRFIVLYGMGVSLMSAPDSTSYSEALTFLSTHPWAKPWCGMIDEAQFLWLEKTLSCAAEKQERVIVLNHFPIHSGTTSPNHSLLWNHDRLLSLLLRFPNVALHLNGHYHYGGYERVQHVHCLTLESLVESSEQGGASILHLFDDALFIEGIGDHCHRELSLS